MKWIIAEVLLVVLLLYIIVMFMSWWSDEEENGVSPYECGFDPFVGSRLEFSYRFFLVSILFLIFDVEVSLLLPLPYFNGGVVGVVGVFVFLVVLMVGLLYEYWNGVLSWLVL